jgi:hypothetical protein
MCAIIQPRSLGSNRDLVNNQVPFAFMHQSVFCAIIRAACLVVIGTWLIAESLLLSTELFHAQVVLFEYFTIP